MKWPVFMYHAFSINDKKLLDADLHYSISLEEFSEHITVCIQNGFRISSLLDFSNKANIENEQRLCFFTFDDGHCSNYDAAKLLHKQNFTADFFINTSAIDRKNYLSSMQLKEMHGMGMSIQTHGHEHEYFSDLNNEEIVRQFVLSKENIYRVLESEISIFAPPGGRINRNVVNIAKKNGIKIISNSRPGLFSRRGDLLDIPRIPILRTISKDVFTNLLLNRKGAILKLQIKYYLSKFIKVVLGNRFYDKFRLLILK